MKKYLFLIPLLLIFILSNVSAVGEINITNSPSGDITISGHTAQINSTIDSVNPLSYVQTNLSGTVTNIKDPSLILCYNFDNRSSLGENDTHVVDWCGGNNGTVVGGSNVSMTPNGKYNGGVNFSGNIGFVNSSMINNLNRSSLTISFWLNDKGNGTGGFPRALDFRGYAIAVYRGNTDSQYKLNSRTQNVAIDSFFNTTQLNSWKQITIIKNNDYLSAYVNGVLSINISQVGILNSSLTDNNTYIGSNANNQFWNGSIDEFRVWNRTLNSSEIMNNYLASINKFNNTEYNFYNDVTNITNIISNYNIYANDTLNNNLSKNTIINRKQTINLFNQYNILHNNFYGVNTHGDFLGNSSADSSFNRQVYQNSRMDLIRIDSSLQLSNSTHTFYYANNKKDTITQARSNGSKVIVNLGYMPNYLANISSGYCSTNSSCTPTDYNEFVNLSLDFLNYIGCTPDVCLLEVWNEPDLQGFFLNNLNESSANNSIRSVEYNKLYNATYNGIKNNNSLWQIGGAVTTADSNGYTQLTTNFLTNFSNKLDFVSVHIYRYDSYSIFPVLLTSKINSIKQLCGYNCNVIVDEWNYRNSSVMNTSSLWNIYYSQISQFYTTLINNYANSSQSAFYEFTQEHKYNSTYPLYPERMAMFSSPSYDNAFYPPYNITYLFTRYAPSGFTVYNSTNDYTDGIVQVNTKNGSVNNIIITNIENNPQNISICNLSSNELLMDVNSSNLIQADSNGCTPYLYQDNYSVTPYTNPILNLSNSGLSKYNYLGELIGIGQEINISSDVTNHNVRTLAIEGPFNATANIEVDNIDCDSLSSVTLNGNALTYTCSADILYFTDVDLLTSNSLVINNEVVEQSLNSVCDNSFSGIVAFFGNMPTWLVLIGVFVMISLIAGIVAVLTLNSDGGFSMSSLSNMDVNFKSLGIIIISFGVLAIIAVIMLIAVGAVCSLI